MAQVRLEEQIGGSILHLKGQFIGGKETDELRDVLKSLTEAGTDKLIIDLGEVSYVNSTALGVLISGHSSFLKRDAKIVLCNVGKSIQSIFIITKLTLVFTIADNIEEAIKILSN